MSTNQDLGDVSSNQDLADSATDLNSSSDGFTRTNYTDDVTANTVSLLAITQRSSGLSSTLPQSIPLSLLQWVVFLLGTSGNLFVLLVLLWRRSVAHMVTQMFVGSLCVANIGMMFGVGWIQAMLYIDQRWKFGLIWCKMYYFLSGMTIGCSTWTLAVIAVDRYV